MEMRRSGSFRAIVASAVSVLALTLASADPAFARRHHRPGHVHLAAPAYSPPYAAMVVDANTGRVLHAVNENEPRHPASITKVMTLFMLFEQIERGHMSLDTEMPVSGHAASMAPSKLGLAPGSSITVENAIKAIVTKSANDIAVVVAEAIGGTEDHFAELMTAKAQSLGMNGTHYVNASGLPDDDQITTAHDLITLGRAIQDRFPRHYAYFSTHQFSFHGRIIGNHNHLLGRVEGMDGIKTGYTRASGFNLLSSVRRGDHHIIAVVLGGRSAGVRDHIMEGLIEANIEKGSAAHIAASDVAAAEHAETARPVPRKPEPLHEAAPEPAPAPKAEAAKPEPPRLASTPNAAAQVDKDRPRPAVVANAARTTGDEPTATIPTTRRQALDGSTRSVATASSSGQAGSLHWVTGPAAAPREAARQEARVTKSEPARETAPSRSEISRPAAARSGVMIQIGAADDADKAHELLNKAKSRHGALSQATPFTEKVQKGSETLWRARFAGLNESQAETACKALKRSGFSCFTTRN